MNMKIRFIRVDRLYPVESVMSVYVDEPWRDLDEAEAWVAANLPGWEIVWGSPRIDDEELDYILNDELWWRGKEGWDALK